ncbi:MAG TPA: hypothetical protein VK152_07645, partial [Paludibacter sp.]|nr:hypothetical protein [Paludibacter sp.]
YTVPKSLTEKVKIGKVRVYANGFNLLTLSNLSFVDPEHPSDSYGYLYPIMKNCNLGVNVTF